MGSLSPGLTASQEKHIGGKVIFSWYKEGTNKNWSNCNKHLRHVIIDLMNIVPQRILVKAEEHEMQENKRGQKYEIIKHRNFSNTALVWLVITASGYNLNLLSSSRHPHPS